MINSKLIVVLLLLIGNNVFYYSQNIGNSIHISDTAVYKHDTLVKDPVYRRFRASLNY